MCGITGFKIFTKNSPDLKNNLVDAVSSLKKRGPDFTNTFVSKTTGLGHTRLSIIDTSSNGHQPMTDSSGRYTLIFNGEIYNYKELKSHLVGIEWQSSSDTEVLLHLLIQMGKSCLNMLNGFFSLAFYDKEEDYLLIARDRFGIKPLHYHQNNQFLVFASEMKALLRYPIERKLNHESLYWYLKLTYLPHDRSMVEGVKKLLPGRYLEMRNSKVVVNPFFNLEAHPVSDLSFQNAQKETVRLLEQSVQRRMVSDVPLGAFLSGGTDSSAVVSLASKFNKNLNTFSIGYKDHTFFDETNFAELVAKKFQTNHTTFSLTNEDLLESLDSVVNYLGEPFADSSAIPTYILSQKVSQSMKVALSGDGADELFGGYYKHLAYSNSLKQNFSNSVIKGLGGLASRVPQSRSSKIGNLARRISKYSELLKLSPSNKYWMLASFYQNPNDLLTNPFKASSNLKEEIIDSELSSLNSFLDVDLKLVLPGDMLTKVDLMSMANSLEVRVPFLDKDLVAFARSLPDHFKVSKNQRKKVLQDAFEHILPQELHHRSKKGFEVPMLSWLRNELHEDLKSTVFDYELIQSQGLFKTESIRILEKRLLSTNPGDVHSVLWSLFVFQKWFKNYSL